MQIVPLKSELLAPGSDILASIHNSLRKRRLSLKEGDIIAVASKAIAISQNRIIKLASVRAGSRALKLAQKYGMDAALVQVVLDEADAILGGIHGVLITLKEGVLIANAGVDRSNVSRGNVALWPFDPFGWAEATSKELSAMSSCHVSVIVVDSRVHPLRAGTEGGAIGFAGFEGVKDCRGMLDLHRKPLKITRMAVADDLACAAHVLMGEAAEATPFVLVRGAPVTLSDAVDRSAALIPPMQCLYMGSIFRYPRKLQADR